MYTDDMRRAFRSLDHHKPAGFKLSIIDNEHFLTVSASEPDFFRLDIDGKMQAVQYMMMVKKALEMNGAIVMLVREGGKEDT